MPDRTKWDWLRAEVRAAARLFGEQLRSLPDTSVQVPNLEWSVAELGRHLASLPHLYREQHRVGTSFESPTDWRQFSATARAHITTNDGAELARLIAVEVETLLVPPDPDERRMLYGCETTVANTAAGMMTECILHGQDLGRLTGHKPRLERRHALAGLEQQMALTPVFINPDKAAGLAGVYGLRFRGGSDFTYRIDELGKLAVERGWPGRADARLNADPATFLAASLGRVNPVAAALTGKIIAYGRKPWRMAQLGNAVVDGV
ncbi:MAG: SCP2 sterol-binding domain-containing protein [Acidimicrobiales bacterium]